MTKSVVITVFLLVLVGCNSEKYEANRAIWLKCLDKAKNEFELDKCRIQRRERSNDD